jgi:hypothetical protein
MKLKAEIQTLPYCLPEWGWLRPDEMTADSFLINASVSITSRRFAIWRAIYARL